VIKVAAWTPPDLLAPTADAAAPKKKKREKVHV
jgi:hypothetical protein